MDEGARFPRVAAKAGHYESFYIKACEPGGGRGIWIRHTVHKRPGAEPNASIWFVLFDREADGPRATKVTVPAAELSAPAGLLDPGRRRRDRARAGPRARSTPTRSAPPGRSPSPATPSPASTCRPTGSTRRRCRRPSSSPPSRCARFDGRLEIDDETIELGGWPGMIGHNWGTEHAERWVWLEGTGFADSPDTYFDAGAARVKLGPCTSPWIPSGMLMLDGEPHRLGGLGAIRSASIEESPGACELRPPRQGHRRPRPRLRPEKDFVGWVYADPKGPEHNTVNCSVADLELTVERPGLPPRELTLAAGAAYELGMRETDHGIPIQPYPDG